MLLQTNSYIVPKEKRDDHARLMRRFRQVLGRLGCDNFEVYEQVGTNWSGGQSTGRFVQIMRFRDRKHQLAIQNAERSDPKAQELIAEFCELVNYPYQHQQGLFAVGFYSSVLPVLPFRGRGEQAESEQETEAPPQDKTVETDPPTDQPQGEDVEGLGTSIPEHVAPDEPAAQAPSEQSHDLESAFDIDFSADNADEPSPHPHQPHPDKHGE